MGVGAFLFVHPSAPPLHFHPPLHSALPLRPPHFICGIQAPHSLPVVNQQSRFPHDQEFIQSAILHFFDMQTCSEFFLPPSLRSHISISEYLASNLSYKAQSAVDARVSSGKNLLSFSILLVFSDWYVLSIQRL